jgi:hypothetical protein
VPVRLDGLVYFTGTFTYISVRVFLLMDGQKLRVLEASGVLFQRVPAYENKHYVYAQSIFCNKLALTTNIIKTIHMLPFGTKLISFLTITIKKFQLFR